MSGAEVKSFERARLERLSTAKMVDDNDFSAMIYHARTLWGLSEDDFRDTFGLSAGAVDRWMTGQNLPQPDVRARILKWVLDQISDQ